MTHLSLKFIIGAVFKLKQSMSVTQENGKVLALIRKGGKPIEKKVILY